jgi:hypothetical protein
VIRRSFEEVVVQADGGRQGEHVQGRDRGGDHVLGQDADGATSSTWFTEPVNSMTDGTS